jgi:hypothetical protein
VGVSIAVLTNDALGDPPTTITSVTQGASGSVVIDSGGTSVTYTPDPDTNGGDSFSYTIRDVDLETSSATVSMTVNPVNDPPTADDQSVSTPENTALAITLTGDDVDGDTLSFAIGTGPTHGGLTGTPPDVTYTPDTDYTGPDSFTFTTSDGALSSPDATVSITVTPSTVVPVLTIGDASMTEPDTGTTNVTVVISLSEPSSTSIAVDFATADGSAVAGLDYVAASGTLNIPALATSYDLVLEVIGDLMDEPDETFSVNLSNPAGATLGTPSNGTVTIFDNDPMPNLSAGDVVVGEAAGTADVSVNLKEPSGFEVTVDFATADGTAIAPDDYGATSGVATIPPGLLSTEITITIVDDGEVEPDEFFTLGLSNPSNATLLTPSVTVTIIDDDGCTTPGDADGNCVLDAADISLIISLIDDPTIPILGDPDCDGSGLTDGWDLVCVVEVMVAQ